MNKFLFGTIATFAALAAAPALATPITVMDTTLDYAYTGSSPTTYSAPGFAGPSTGDYVGADFDTEKLVATVGPSSLELKYYTAFGGSDLGAHYADVFLAPASGPTAAPAWSYGISLGTTAQDFQGGAPAGFYALPGGRGTDYLTSQDIWGPKSGYIYGGGYVAPDGTQNLSPTRVVGGDLMAGWTVSATSGASGEAGFPYLVDIILTAPSQAAFDFVFNQAEIDTFWGTADCSNDALFAPVRVPEPMSLSLFAAGLGGAFMAYGRRRKKAA